MAETHRIGCCMKKYNNNLGNLVTKHSETCLENAPRLLNKKTPTCVFLWILQKLSEYPFYRTPPGGCIWRYQFFEICKKMIYIGRIILIFVFSSARLINLNIFFMIMYNLPEEEHCNGLDLSLLLYLNGVRDIKY